MSAGRSSQDVACFSVDRTKYLMLSKSIALRSEPQVGSGLRRKSLRPLRRRSSIHCGSLLRMEMSRTTSSLSPRGRLRAGDVGVGPAVLVAADALEFGVELLDRGHEEFWVRLRGVREGVRGRLPARQSRPVPRRAGRWSCRHRRRGRWSPAAAHDGRAAGRRPRSPPRTAEGTRRRRARPGSGAGRAGRRSAWCGQRRRTRRWSAPRQGRRTRSRGSAADNRARKRSSISAIRRRANAVTASGPPESRKEAQGADGQVVVGLQESVAAGVGERRRPWRAGHARVRRRCAARAPGERPRRPAGRGAADGGRRQGQPLARAPRPWRGRSPGSSAPPAPVSGHRRARPRTAARRLLAARFSQHHCVLITEVTQLRLPCKIPFPLRASFGPTSSRPGAGRPRLLTSSAPALEVECDLVMRYGEVTAVDGLSLRVEPATVTAILGPNGAGKTTTSRRARGTADPRREPSGCWGSTRRPARPAGAPAGRDAPGGGSMVRCGPTEMLTISRRCTPTRSRSTLLVDRLGLGSCGRTSYRRLSGGQQQRLDLAMAVVGRPEMVFLDEPTSGLDPQARRATWELVEQLVVDGVTVVLTTHYMEEAERLAGRVPVIDRGRVMASGSPADLTGGGCRQNTIRLRASRRLHPRLRIAAAPWAARSPSSRRGLLVDGEVDPIRWPRSPPGAPAVGVMPEDLTLSGTDPRGRVPRAHRPGAARVTESPVSTAELRAGARRRAGRRRWWSPRPGWRLGCSCATASSWCSRSSCP